jgi:hypothetical protein
MKIEVKTAIDHIHSLLRNFRCTREVERLDYPTRVVVTMHPPWICPTLLKVQFTFSRKRSKQWECAVLGLSKKMLAALQHHRPAVERWATVAACRGERILGASD